MCVCLAHITVCMCASVNGMYRVHNGTQWPPITYKVLWNCMMERANPMGTNTMYVHCMRHAAHMHMYLCAQRTSHVGTPHAWKVAIGIQFHLHNVRTCIRV